MLEKHIIYIYMVDRNFKVIMFLNVNLYHLYDTLWFCTSLGSFRQISSHIKKKVVMVQSNIQHFGDTASIYKPIFLLNQ